MGKVNLNLVIHNHQPVGNFNHVFEWAYDKCYRHIIDILQAHPKIKMSLHISGPLLDWLMERQPTHIDQIVKLVDKKQIEIIGGAYYEPIIAVLRTEDAIGQIKMMQEKWKQITGKTPRGMWVAERIWEPALPVLLNEAGVEYVVLDDEHFFSAGIDKKAPLTGYYHTERQGKRVSVFPSDKGLRYRIPYQETQRTIEYLAEIGEKTHHPICMTYGDDGEKFGVWPDTYKSVIEEKWLDRFFTALESNSNIVQTTTLEESYSTLEPEGLIYLPTASYAEMLEWAMPARSIADYEKLKKAVEHDEHIKHLTKFVKGGFWDNFLVKYPEANHIHKRMISVSQRLSDNKKKLPESAVKHITEHLYKSQCNCAYWHGLFGGVYLNHLRHGLWENLIEAEKTLDKELKTRPAIQKVDFNFDGSDELYYSNPVYSVLIDPKQGGSVVEVDYRRSNINIVNTLGRRKEAYHAKMKKMSEKPKDPQSAVSIHEAEVYIQDDAYDGFAYDKYRRNIFMEHIVPVDTSLEDLRLQRYKELCHCASEKYQVSKLEKESVKLKLSTSIKLGEINIPIRLEKIYDFNSTGFDMMIGVMNESTEYDIEFMLMVESNINLLSPHDPGRYITIDGVKPKDHHLASAGVCDAKKIMFIDEYWGNTLHYSCETKAKLFRYPIETISVGEHGGEKVFQGTCLVWGIPIMIEAGGGTAVSFKLAFTTQATQ
jgi:4-alpha-glucanotransferase